MRKNISLAIFLMATSYGAHAATVVTQLNFWDYYQNPDALFPTTSSYGLSNGTTHVMSAGQRIPSYGTVVKTELEGNTVSYTFEQKPNLLGNSDVLFSTYFFAEDGDYSYLTSVTLERYSPLVLKAELGSDRAKMTGYAKVTAINWRPDWLWWEANWMDNAANVGDLVYFELDYHIWSSSNVNSQYAYTQPLFTEDLYNGRNGFLGDSHFHSTISGKVDFTNKFIPTAVPEPSTYAMLGLGLGLLGVATRRRKSA